MRRPSRRHRCLQVAGWLKENFPAPCPVEVRFVRPPKKTNDRLFGYCEKVSRRVRITIVDCNCWPTAVMIDTLLHEWSHAVVIFPARFEAKAGFTHSGKDQPRELFPHDPIWGVCLAAITTAFHDAEIPGREESFDFPTKYTP